MEPKEIAIGPVRRGMFVLAVAVGMGLQIWAALLAATGRGYGEWFLLPVLAGIVAAAYVAVLLAAIHYRMISHLHKWPLAVAGTLFAIEFIALLAATLST